LIFKPVSREEFDRMTVDERMAYLHRLMTDIREKLKQTRLQQEALTKKLPKDD
jgi:hypothetical protein